MSLDVALIIRSQACSHCGRGDEERYVFEANITHNLHAMAIEAGIGQHLWAPQEIGITQAQQLVSPLEIGIALIESDPDRFRQLEPSNKWGTYHDFIPWLRQYLEACKAYPEAEITVSR